MKLGKGGQDWYNGTRFPGKAYGEEDRALFLCPSLATGQNTALTVLGTDWLLKVRVVPRIQ